MSARLGMVTSSRMPKRTLADGDYGTIFETFSHAAAGFGVSARETLEELVFSRHAHQVLRLAIEGLRNEDRRVLPGLDSLLDEWASKPESPCWSRPIGQLWRLTSNPNSHVSKHALVDVGLIGSINGIGGDWGFQLEAPALFRLDRFLVTNVLSGQIKRDGLKVYGELRSIFGWVFRFVAHNDAMSGSSIEAEGRYTELPANPKVGNSAIVIIPGNLVSSDLLPTYAEASFFELSDFSQSGIALAEALQCLSEFAPPLRHWVTSVIREVVPIRSLNGELASSSSPWDCGSVAITVDPRSVAVAEMLVHEASHQHFFIAKHLGRIDDGSDCNEYYSPMVRQRRPLEKILLAFHALGNMALLHASIINENTISTEFSRLRMMEISQRLEKVQPVLESSRALTALGACLYEPLADRIARLRRAGLLN